ncbi:MAG: 50S ribosomal protein L6 [Planctomycetes bacterium]|nr:50S ribosomal protein L6 [Planctomycetota bacterium]
MSRIGKTPIEVPKGVTVSVADGSVTVKGPKGERQIPVRREVKVSLDDTTLTVDTNEESRFAHAMRGTMRSLLNNAVVGVTEGYTKKLEVQGVGFEVDLKGKDLILKIGFNMPKKFRIPDTVTVECPTLTDIVISGTDNQQVGQVAAEIRKLRKPEPYKGKGIKYAGEVIKRKAGKAFGSGG